MQNSLPKTLGCTARKHDKIYFIAIFPVFSEEREEVPKEVYTVYRNGHMIRCKDSKGEPFHNTYNATSGDKTHVFSCSAEFGATCFVIGVNSTCRDFLPRFTATAHLPQARFLYKSSFSLHCSVWCKTVVIFLSFFRKIRTQAQFPTYKLQCFIFLFPFPSLNILYCSNLLFYKNAFLYV